MFLGVPEHGFLAHGSWYWMPMGDGSSARALLEAGCQTSAEDQGAPNPSRAVGGIRIAGTEKIPPGRAPQGGLGGPCYEGLSFLDKARLSCWYLLDGNLRHLPDDCALPYLFGKRAKDFSKTTLPLDPAVAFSALLVPLSHVKPPSREFSFGSSLGRTASGSVLACHEARTRRTTLQATLLPSSGWV